MGWKRTGRPVVRQQRGRWVVRVDGIDTKTGRKQPRQLGTYPSRRAATVAAADALIDGSLPATRGTVGWLVEQWVANQTHVSPSARVQYAWAADHIKKGFGAIPAGQLDRGDVARWLDELARAGHFSRRSIQMLRRFLRAALEDAVQEGLLARNVAARVPMPREVAKVPKAKTAAWTAAEVTAFLRAAQGYRWEAALRVEVLYGLRRSEVLALRWDDVDFDAMTLRVDEGLVDVRGTPMWTKGKNARSRRTIPLDASTLRALTKHRALQNQERLLAGPLWEDTDLIVATQHGHAVHPRNYSQTLERVIKRAGVPMLTSHGLRHTAATHMVRDAADVGELRAVADVLGHSPDMLMKTYAHALPDSVRAVADKVAQRIAATEV